MENMHKYTLTALGDEIRASKRKRGTQNFYWLAFGHVTEQWKPLEQYDR